MNILRQPIFVQIQGDTFGPTALQAGYHLCDAQSLIDTNIQAIDPHRWDWIRVIDLKCPAQGGSEFKILGISSNFIEHPSGDKKTAPSVGFLGYPITDLAF
jgi:hypothetical protein